ncbi:ash family protein [Salmonella enterica]|nr:ash family protein [Salmonella enterica]
MMSMKPSKAFDRLNCWRYAYPAPQKTGAGRENPKIFKATPDAASVFFCVRHMRHSMVWCTLFNVDSAAAITHNGVYHAAYNGGMCGYSAGLAPSTDTLNRTSRRPRMVTLAGQPQGWPVSLKAGILTPVDVTALFERENSSDSLSIFKEAVYHG